MSGLQPVPEGDEDNEEEKVPYDIGANGQMYL